LTTRAHQHIFKSPTRAHATHHHQCVSLPFAPGCRVAYFGENFTASEFVWVSVSEVEVLCSSSKETLVICEPVF
jgi:hypothetical protein